MNDASRAIADLIEANDPEIESIEHFAKLTRHGYGWVDLHYRVEGREYRTEADWLVRLLRLTPEALAALSAPREPSAARIAELEALVKQAAASCQWCGGTGFGVGSGSVTWPAMSMTSHVEIRPCAHCAPYRAALQETARDQD